jgi:hypothetical protein
MKKLTFKETGGFGMWVKDKSMFWKVLQVVVGSILGALAVYGFCLLFSFI